MRTFILLFCSTIFALSPTNGISQNAKIKINEDTILSVDDIFSLIEKQTDYNFVYGVGLFEKAPKIALKKGTVKVYKLLEECLSQTVFTYNFIDDEIIILKRKPAFVGTELVVIPQQRISGKVTDEAGNPLPGVNVLVGEKGSSKVRGVATDINGTYSIMASKDEVIKFSYVGFSTQEFVITDQQVIDVVLTESASSLNEVVVVGYGTTQKKDLTGSVGSINSKKITQVKTQTIDQALVGQLTGVFVESNAGAPGSGASINIRGLSQIIGDNQPLYVIDGVPIVVNQNYGEFAGSTNSLNPLFNIDQNNVERVDVLKDASAAAIYGSRAANGVIIITTKKGRKNQEPQFNVSVNTTYLKETGREDYLNASEFKAYAIEVGGVDPNTFFMDGDTDWQDLILQGSPLWNQFNFNTSGGTDRSSYFLGATFNDQDGLLLGNNLKRYNVIANVETLIKDKFRVGGSLNYTYGINKASGLNSLGSAANFRPDFPVYNDDGSYTYTTGYYGNYLNPLGDEARMTSKDNSQNLFGTIYGELEIIKNLKFTSRINVSLNNVKQSQFSPSFTNDAIFSGINFGFTGAKLSNETIDGYTSTFLNQLNYSGIISTDHRIDAMAAISWDRSYQNIESQMYAGFPDDFILTNIGSALSSPDFNSSTIESGLNSIFGRVNYNYKDRYLVTFTARSDGSTKFGPENERGFFPSAGIAWNLHNEDFFRKNETISQLKLRASLGKTGTDNLPAFSFLTYYVTPPTFSAPLLYNGENGIVPNGVPNPEIRWEETKQLDLGLEFGLFNGRLNGEIVYFEKNTSDLILFTPIPYETGAVSFSSNVADVINNGWEITIGGDIVNSNDFRWNSSFNISFIKNEVTALNGGQNSNFLGGSLRGIAEGEPIGYINGYIVEGIAQTQAEVDALNANAPDGNYFSGFNAPGDYIFKDLNGDNEITTADLTNLGDINPDFFGGWNNSITYKNFDLNFNFQFVEGVSREWTASRNLNRIDLTMNQHAVVLDTWTPNNPDAKYARHGSSTNGRTNSRLVEDGSYIRLRSASLGYNLPSDVVNKLGLSRARLSISGNNLFTITDYSGVDPENVTTFSGGSTVERTSDNGFSYPLAKTFTLGLNLSF
ncbi:TonB-dependent receptor [Flavobacteriaceae bacterium F08102]|nr:TonB-dependent receptor [Flavobacteriaceae bacterium F08102]